VKFPNGTYGVYGRIVWKSSLKGIGGIAVLPISEDGKIYLNINFRHATRSWELELARGGVNQFESIEQAACRELKEETGLISNKLVYLGEMLPDSGLTNTRVPVYLARVIRKEKSNQEDSEAIIGTELLSIDEIKNGFNRGFIMKEINGVTQKINIRDPFLSFALFQAMIKKVID
jgi:ADP-ribose pyrophosphatase